MQMVKKCGDITTSERAEKNVVYMWARNGREEQKACDEKSKVAYLLIYSGDTYLHNTHHSLSLSLPLCKRIALFRTINLSPTVALLCWKETFSPIHQIHDEMFAAPLTSSCFLLSQFFYAAPGQNSQTPETRVVEAVSTNLFLLQPVHACYTLVDHEYLHFVTWSNSYFSVWNKGNCCFNLQTRLPS